MEGYLLLLLCVSLLSQEGRGASPGAPQALGCGGNEVVKVAEEALQKINQDRSSGYIWSLNRLYDVYREQEKGHVLYKLTLDVLETRCHIISRKPWKQCEVRDIGSIPVYGECEVLVYFDSEVQLQNYSCAVREVPATVVVSRCPDCPTSDKMDEPIVMETSKLCLQRFNRESNLNNYFRVENITKASSQWVFSASYFVEFTIVETVCSKTSDPSELEDCPPMDCQFAHRGFCSGSHVTREEEFHVKPPAGKKEKVFPNPVRVECEIYEPQVSSEENLTRAEGGTPELQHHNHTHLHAHEQTHQDQDKPASDRPESRSRPQGLLGTVVDQPSSPRPPPSAPSCPTPQRHQNWN